MMNRGIGLLEKEAVIIGIDLLSQSSDSIRIVVESDLEGRGRWNDHAMLNIEDDQFVSLERFHSILSTFDDLSKSLNRNINSNNYTTTYGDTITFTRYAIDVNSVLVEIAQLSKSRRPSSRTICCDNLRVEYDWLYISRLCLKFDVDSEQVFKEKILNYIHKNLSVKFKIGNFRSQAMRITRFTDEETTSLMKSMENDKRGRWILHSPRKLLYHNRYTKCTEYSFKYNYLVIANGAFSGFCNLKHIILPKSVKYIGAGAFMGCENLSEVLLSENLRSIGPSCFCGCSSLQRIIIPNNVKEIESLAFRNCEALKEIVMPDSLRNIGWSVFEGCPNDISIIINRSFKDDLIEVLDKYSKNIVVWEDSLINQKRSYVSL